MAFCDRLERSKESQVDHHARREQFGYLSCVLARKIENNILLIHKVDWFFRTDVRSKAHVAHRILSDRSDKLFDTFRATETLEYLHLDKAKDCEQEKEIEHGLLHSEVVFDSCSVDDDRVFTLL